MAKNRFRLALHLALVCFLVTGLVTDAVSLSLAPPPTLNELAKGSRAMAVARVECVHRVAGLRVARAVVVRRIAGLQMGHQFAFLASPTSAYDKTGAEKGETVLLFLAPPDRNGIGRLSESEWLAFEKQVSAELQGVPFFHIYGSGHGRLSIEVQDGQEFVEARSLWFYSQTEAPPNIRRRVKADGKYMLQLSDVERYLRAFTKAGIPSYPPEVSRPPMCAHKPLFSLPPHWGHRSLLVIFSVLGAAAGAMAVSVHVCARFAHRPVGERPEGTRQ